MSSAVGRREGFSVGDAVGLSVVVDLMVPVEVGATELLMED
jgi:hypothetical protein